MSLLRYVNCNCIWGSAFVVQYSTVQCSTVTLKQKREEKPGFRKEMKCSGDSQIFHELVRDTSQKLEKHGQIREVL